MAVLLDRLPNLTPDYSGAISALKQMGGCVILCGPPDCLDNYHGMEETDAASQDAMLCTSDTTEREAILGLEKPLVKRAVALARDYDPPFVALIGSPVSAIVGADLEGMARSIEAETGTPTIAVDTTGFELYPAGIAKAYDALVGRFVDMPSFCADGKSKAQSEHPHASESPTDAAPIGSSDPNTSPAASRPIAHPVNILGYTHLDFCNGDDLSCLIRTLEGQGETAACIIGKGGVENLPLLLEAERSLVVSAGALPLARKLEQLAGIPYTCDLPIAGDAPAPPVPPHLAAGKRVLVVGDQVVAHALRIFVESRYGAACDVATAYRLDRTLARPGDARTKDEHALAAKVDQGYDFVVADPMCLPVVQDHQGFVGLPRPAVSSLVHKDNYVKLFDSEIVRDLDRAMTR